MNSHKYPVKSFMAAAVIGVMSHHTAHAGAFALYTESSAAEIGNFAAGAAAEAADASTAWYNPAGLVLLKKQQAIISGVGVFPSSKLTGTSTFSAPESPSYIQSFTNLQGAENALVPALHYARPLGDSAAVGLSIVAPYGLSTRYKETSPVRYAATLTDLRTIDVSPDIAGKLNDNFSFGLGIDFQYAEVKFNGMAGVPILMFLNPAAVSATTFDSASTNQGYSFGIGFHTGLMGIFNQAHTRIGLNYQSKMGHQFNGRSTLSGPLSSETFPEFVTGESFGSNRLYSNDINLPDVLTLSAYQDINNQLALLGSVIYTGWSSFKTIELHNVVTGFETYNDISTPENYRDAWRAAVGLNYKIKDKWMMRVGGGYDQTPTVNSARDVRLPDANRWALSAGTHYQALPNLGIDVGYTYLFALNKPTVNTTTIVDADTEATYAVNATAKVNAQLVGAQLVWAIDGTKTA